MRIAVSSTGQGLEAEMDPRFGRCDYFVIVDGDTMDAESVENPNVMAAGGAGIQSAQLVAGKGAEVVLTGHCGPNAFQTLEAAGIPVCVGAGGSVRHVVELYKKGELAPAGGPNAASKSGTVSGGDPGSKGNPFNPGSGQGMSGGAGGGAGGGMGGTGLGRGMGRRGAGMGGGGGGIGGRGGGMGGRGGGMGGRDGGIGGRGAGMGGGRGSGAEIRSGTGRWRAWCRGWGLPMDKSSPFDVEGDVMPQGATLEDLGVLKTQAKELRTQLDRIRQRIEEIEKSEGQ
jgi:predicted Fe-Mo cluster-binding NifX family protein